MDKRTFLKNTSLLIGGAAFHPILSCTPKKPVETITPERLKNWAENFEFSTSNVHYPKTVEEVGDIVLKCDHLSVLGSRHSFNRIADSTDNLISFQHLNKVISLDREKSQVTVEGGIKYGDLSAYLHENGFALHNLASLPHISVAGTIATATHGSGLGNGNLSTSVAAIEFVNAKGELVTLSRDKDPEFYGAVVALGGLGPVTKVTLDLLPAFEVAQVIYLNMPMESLKDHFNEIMGAGYSVSLFIDWKSNSIAEVWVKKKLLPGEEPAFPEDLFGAKKATVKMHPVPDMDPESCSEQLGVAGPWFDRLPHFKMEFQPSAGKELQSEFFVPLENGYEAILAVSEMAEQINPYLFISEIRSIKADELWMSTCYQRDSIAIHTTWKQEIPEVMAFLPQMEGRLNRFNPRPHWAKLFTIPSETLQSRYPKIEEFKALLSKHDPEGKFRNEFLNRTVFGVS
ncbi:xylitol oxidase [Algoriphagus alkaliphilus]|uniref:Xylitol oxidase n=2 Tax=Algoriphagus TaxID=246875 RepID=A0A1G5VUJ6_9BACT|nr:D-arabinono-1,4-lactone oxidase [Algoriphagus alkaliphilus]SDA49571.1 xylitol oxidase [Algoriphagus alkaliphilus]